MHSIGRVVSVSFDKLVFEVSDFNKLNYNLFGFTYIAKGVVDYVTIINDMHQRFIYQVIKAEDKEQILTQEENSKLEHSGRFECIPVGVIIDDEIEFNMKIYPFLQNRVYLTSEEEKNIIFSINNGNNTINLGLIEDRYHAQISLSKLFSHHCAILGNTGSGKSTTIRQIISETMKQNTSNLHLHIFDVHDEYQSNFQNDEEVRIIDVIENYQININDLDLQDWINLVKPSDLVQMPLLQTALKLSDALEEGRVSEIWIRCYLAYTLYTFVQTDAVAKRAKIVSLLQNTNIDTSQYSAQYANMTNQAEATFLNALQGRMNNEHEGESEYLFLQEQIELSKYKTSSFTQLLKGLEFAFLLEECKGNAQARSYCGTLETRIKSIQTRYGVLINDLDNQEDNNNNINNNPITVYSVSTLDDDLLLFFTSYFIKNIYEKSKSMPLAERDLNIFILEEAHRYVSKSKESSAFQEIERFKKIAREGRKFGCFLFLSSQRPSELSSTVLSQCNNYLIHRIKNNIDLEYMLKTIPYIDKNQLTRMSYLPTGTSFLVGELFPIPIEISVTNNERENISTTPEIKYNM